MVAAGRFETGPYKNTVVPAKSHISPPHTVPAPLAAPTSTGILTPQGIDSGV